MLTNGDGPDNDGAGAELDPVPHAGREKLAALAIRLVAQGAVVAQDAVTPHLHAVTDDDILRVIEAQAPTQPGSWRDIEAAQQLEYLEQQQAG